MNDKNILILSAGRRVELVERFKRARKKMNISGKIVAVDISETAPAIYFADTFQIVPRITDDTYIDEIIKICNGMNIDLVVPTIDTELLKLSDNRRQIETNTKSKLLLSNDKVIKICRNKKETYKFFKENGFLVPAILNEDDIRNEKYQFPLFIKPLDGSSSINTFKINNKEELIFFKNYVKNPVIQEFIEGTEFSVDVFCDFNGNPITIVPRERIAVRGGEISKGKIIKDNEIILDIKRMVNILKPIGHITIQCMKTQKGIEYIEINPRFGGGAPMSIDAGADSCENLYRLLLGEKLVYSEKYNDNITFVRFDSSIMLNEKQELTND